MPATIDERLAVIETAVRLGCRLVVTTKTILVERAYGSQHAEDFLVVTAYNETRQALPGGSMATKRAAALPEVLTNDCERVVHMLDRIAGTTWQLSNFEGARAQVELSRAAREKLNKVLAGQPFNRKFRR